MQRHSGRFGYTRHIPAKFRAGYVRGTSSAAWVTGSGLARDSPPRRSEALRVSQDGRREDDVRNEYSARVPMADANLSAFPCLQTRMAEAPRGGRRRTNPKPAPRLRAEPACVRPLL
jgi:hypothetical protein